MSTRVYIVGRCPRCGVQFRKRAWHMKSVRPDCGRHEAEKKREQYEAKHFDGLCVWSGCNKKRVRDRSMCEEHLAENRARKAARKKRCSKA